jgi:two-component system sensor histidine kinase VicK
MFDMLEQDARICFAFDLSTRTLLYANNAFKKFFNSDHSYFTLSYLLSFVRQEDKRDLISICLNMHLGEFVKDMELQIELEQNKIYWIKLNLHLNSKSLEPILTGYFEDISAFKKENSKLSDYADQKNAVSNILAHDLAGPLGNIHMVSQIAAQELTGDEQTQKLIKDIEHISKQGLDLIRNYVEGEFLDSAGEPFVLQSTDLVRPLSNLLRQYQESLLTKHLKFEFDSSENEVYANIDEPKFLQAINNLISNATKFTPEGGKICLSIKSKIDAVLITISDTGLGIAKKHHASLFNKFNSARRPGLNGQPTVGLGMSIIKTIIEWHNATIWFTSEENFGTTFFVELKSQAIKVSDQIPFQ